MLCLINANKTAGKKETVCTNNISLTTRGPVCNKIQTIAAIIGGVNNTVSTTDLMISATTIIEINK